MAQLWTATDEYFVNRLVPSATDPVFVHALKDNTSSGLPPHDVSPAQGKLLYLFAKMQKAEKVLEIGTLGAYSTIWLARALPEHGRVVTIEYSPKHAAVAKRNIERAGLSNKIDLRVGAALDVLPQLEKEGLGPFDLVFIDADKPNNPSYLDWSLKLSRKGTVIIGDNVVREGKVIDANSQDGSVQGVRKFIDKLSGHPLLESTAVQTVGCKGHDGFSISIVKADPRNPTSKL